MGINKKENKILIFVFLLSILFLMMFVTSVEAQKRVPDYITTEIIASIEILSNNELKMNFKFLHTNPTPNIEKINLTGEGLVLHLSNTDLSDISDIAVRGKYLDNLSYHTREYNGITDIVVDIDFIRIDPYGNNFVEVEYINREISIKDETNLFTERKTLPYRYVTLEEVNSYTHTLRIPKKPFLLDYFIKVRLVDVLAPPDNFYETRDYYELVWKIDKTHQKSVYVNPIRVTYEYYWDFIAIFDGIVNLIVITIVAVLFEDYLSNLRKKRKAKGNR